MARPSKYSPELRERAVRMVCLPESQSACPIRTFRPVIQRRARRHVVVPVGKTLTSSRTWVESLRRVESVATVATFDRGRRLTCCCGSLTVTVRRRTVRVEPAA
jgi:hypothetical protein